MENMHLKFSIFILTIVQIGFLAQFTMNREQVYRMQSEEYYATSITSKSYFNNVMTDD